MRKQACILFWRSKLFWETSWKWKIKEGNEEISSYHGSFKNKMFHGLGTLTFKSGSKYVG